MEILGQIVGFIFAGLLFWKAFKLYDNNKNAAGHLMAVIAASIFLCSVPWFQGWAKSFIASNIISKLNSLGKQVNTVQETTTEMHTQLDKHQKELDVVQAKIREAESNVLSQQIDITNQFHQISMVQSDLASAQTNLLVQQKILTNVESLVNILFSNTEDEEFSTSDTNKVIILKLGGVQQVVLKLKHAPIPYTIQALLTQGSSGQTPLLPTMGQTANVLFTKFYNEVNLNGVSFHIRYIKDTRTTNTIQNMAIVGSNSVSFDGRAVQF